MKAGHAVALTFLTSIFLTGSGCSETDIGGDTGIDTPRDVSSSEPSFDPPIENLGDPGWRDSTEPWCYDGELGRHGWGVWSDSRGVFVAVDLYSTDSGPSIEEHTIYHNDGTGWIAYLTEPSISMELCITSLTGIPGGVIFGWDTYTAHGQLITIDDGVEHQEGFAVFDVFAVNEDLSYAIPLGDPRLVKYEGGSWGPLPGDPVPYNVFHVWANEEIIFVAGESGIMLSNEEGSWTVHDTRTMGSFTAVWGFSPVDVWASTQNPNQLLHYDGELWQQVEWPDPSDPDDACDSSEIKGFWGKDDVLFFITESALVRWDGEEFTVLGHWPRHDTGSGSYHNCTDGLWINDIWGNEIDEVFLAIHNSDVYDADCGEEFLLWWDGSEFHWF